MANVADIESLRNMVTGENDLELAVLIGSRATGRATEQSDWDIAVRWRKGLDWMQQLAATERLRAQITRRMGISDSAVDLIDMNSTRLAMRSVIADEGIALKGEDTLAWHRFLQRTWREQETYHWETLYGS
jgi:predicted nucleotidyltransferase